MGLLDFLLSPSSNSEDMPEYIRKGYEKVGLDPDNEVRAVNKGKKMYCTMCRRIYHGGCRCVDCNNPLVEWK